MEKSDSFKYYTPSETEHQNSWNAGFGIVASDRRLAFSRQASFDQSREPHTPISINLNDPAKPLLSRSVSGIDIPPGFYSLDENDKFSGEGNGSAEKFSVLLFVSSVFRIMRSGNRYMKRLLVMISLNVAYSTAELTIGLFTGRVGLVSDSFHLTFGCGLLTFSLFAMAASRKRPDRVYTYGYKRLEVLSAFTNALFLLFLSFSLAVEALHAFIQDESEHKWFARVTGTLNSCFGESSGTFSFFLGCFLLLFLSSFTSLTFFNLSFGVGAWPKLISMRLRSKLWSPENGI